jgi:hypothetical protein
MMGPERILTTQYTRSSEHARLAAVFSVDRATTRC